MQKIHYYYMLFHKPVLKYTKIPFVAKYVRQKFSTFSIFLTSHPSQLSTHNHPVTSQLVLYILHS